MNKNEIIQVLKSLLFRQEIKDRTKNKETYVKKTRVYKDIITLLEEYLSD